MSQDWSGRKIARLRQAVLAEFGPVCCRCGGRIDTARAWPDPLSLSLDHLVPRSRGGSDDVSNLRPCHLHCNCAAGARPAWRARPPAAGRFF